MNSYTSYIVMIILVIWLTAREKAVRPSRMWIVPILWTYMVISGIRWQSIDAAQLAMFAVCLLLGLATGVFRGKMEKMRSGSNGQITVQGSIASIALFVFVLGLRMLAEYWGQTHSFFNIANALLFIPLGSVCARSYVIYQRYQAMSSPSRGRSM